MHFSHFWVFYTTNYFSWLELYLHNYFVNLHHVHGEGGDGTGHNNEVHAVPHLPEEGPGVQHQTIQNYLKNNENLFTLYNIYVRVHFLN